MIKVIERDNREYPDWVKECPQCQKNNSEVLVEISSPGLYVHFALCEKCRKELSEKLVNKSKWIEDKAR